MKAYYAQFAKDEQRPDLWNVSFPDLEGCVTYGESLDEAMEMAADALTSWLCAARKRGETVPSPSSKAEVIAMAEAEDARLGIKKQPGTVYLLVAETE